MADNYLERKFEEYRSQKAVRRKSPAVAGAKCGKWQACFLRRRVLVTGGAKGIGRAVVEAFREVGCQVAFCDVDELEGRRTAEATGSRFFPVDVADAGALERCMERIFKDWGDIDVLINNVGVSEFRPLEEATVDDFDRIVSVNLRPVFVTSRRLAIHRKSLPVANGYGRIINICSTRYLMSEPGTECYAASKGGIYSLTHALAISLSDLHITVNSISPGWIQTENYERLADSDHSQHPSGRVGKPSDVARICLFLALPDNDFINGENITVDGGMTKKMIYSD